MMGKGRTLGISLLPALLWILIQCAVVLGFPPVMSGIGNILSLLGVDTGEFYGFLEKNGSYCIYILMDVIMLIPAVLWFRRFPVRREKKEGRFFGISFRGILLLLLAGLCLQLLSNLFLTLVFGIFPELMESYSQVLENLGMDSPTVLSLRRADFQRTDPEDPGGSLSLLGGKYPSGFIFRNHPWKPGTGRVCFSGRNGPGVSGEKKRYSGSRYPLSLWCEPFRRFIRAFLGEREL